MANIIRSITRSLKATPNAPTDDVHFHGGAHGAYVCENAMCSSPGLDPAER